MKSPQRRNNLLANFLFYSLYSATAPEGPKNVALFSFTLIAFDFNYDGFGSFPQGVLRTKFYEITSILTT